MGTPLEEYYNLPPVTPTTIPLPALERKKNLALGNLYLTGATAMLMDGSDPRVQAITQYAESAIFYAEMKMDLNFSPYEICKYVEESESNLKTRITDYNQSKAEYGQKSMDYSRASEQFDSKLKNNKIRSSPLDFSREPGINESKLTFPSKKEIVSCVNQSPLSREQNNTYLNDIKVVDRVSGALAGKEMLGLHMKDKVLIKVGEMRDKGDLDHIPPSHKNIHSLASMYEAFGKCAVKMEPKPTATQSPEEKSKDDAARDFALMKMLSDLDH